MAEIYCSQILMKSEQLIEQVYTSILVARYLIYFQWNQIYIQMTC